MSYTILQLVHIDETGDSYYRMRWPAQELARQNPEWRVINLDAAAAERFDWAREADLLVLFQSQDLDFLPIIEERKRAGKKTLVEYNDNFYAPPPASPVYDAWSAPSIHAAYESIMQAGDALIVTGPGLKELFSKKTSSSIHILENHLPDPPPAFDSVWNEDTKTVHLAWAGSIGHMSDLLSVLPVVRELMEKHPQLHFHVMGNEALPNYMFMPQDRFHYTPWGGMDEYYEFWKPIHLGLIPLLDTPYNQCRSDIKPLEMGSRGVLPILQVQTPYRELAKTQGLPTFETHHDLRSKLESFLGDLSQAKELAQKFHEYVSEERLASNRKERSELYQSHLPKKPGSYDWKLPAGSHEVKGETEANSQIAERALKVRQLVQTGQHQEALGLIESGPQSLDLRLVRLQVLARTDKKKFKEELRLILDSYDEDPRVGLLEIESLDEEQSRVEKWASFLEQLREKPIGLRENMKPIVLNYLVRDLKRSVAYLSVAEAGLEIYPEVATLRFVLARRYDETNESQKALEQYEWLLEFHQKAVTSSDFILSFDRRELLSVVDGLKARLD